VTYQENFNGDSSNIYVEEPEFSLLNLLPGRNYSLGVQAVAKGIESVGKSIIVATRECIDTSPLPINDLIIILITVHAAILPDNAIRKFAVVE